MNRTARGGRPADPPAQRPRRRLLAVCIALASLLFGALGVWQLQRLGEVRSHNAILQQRTASEPLSYREAAAGMTIEQLEFRRITAGGTYDPGGQVLVRSRQHNGQNGFHLLVPLRADGLPAILVNRGWIPAGVDNEPAVGVQPPGGQVHVTGILQRSEEPPALLGARDPAEGHLDRVFRADVERLAQQLPYAVFPMWILAEQERPAPSGRFPIPAPAPAPDPGPHLLYAIQWFAFAGIAVVGFLAYRRAGRTTA